MIKIAFKKNFELMMWLSSTAHNHNQTRYIGKSVGKYSVFLEQFSTYYILYTSENLKIFPNSYS